MFCPRCAAPISEQLKYCRGCGLPVSQVTSYVASGGTQDLVRPQVTHYSPPADSSLTPLQKMILKIVAVCLAPPFVAAFAALLDLPPELAMFPAIFLPFGILIASFQYRSQKRRLSASDVTVEQQNTIARAPVQQMLPPKETNPLEARQPASVIEEETIRLPREG
jgi:hypothetical protein